MRARVVALRRRAEAHRQIRHALRLLDGLPSGRRATGPRPALAGLRVLLVDDDALVRDATRLLLESEGARVTEARDGADALGVLSRQPFDLVLCDLRMPRLDGFGLLRRLRLDPRWAATPVIALSALPDRHATNADGFDGHIGKPFEAAELTQLLARFRRQRAA